MNSMYDKLRGQIDSTILPKNECFAYISARPGRKNYNCKGSYSMWRVEWNTCPISTPVNCGAEYTVCIAGLLKHLRFSLKSVQKQNGAN